MKIMVECPVCSAKVEEGKINKHMDGPECKLEGSDVEILEESNKGTPKLCENQCPQTKEVQSTGQKQSHDKLFTKLVGKRPCDQENGLEKVKKARVDTEETNSLVNEKVSQQKIEDDFIISDLLEDNNEWEEESELPPSQQKIILSPSISYNPARFGGLHNISPSPDAKLVRTGSGSAKDKYPKKSPRKNLFTSPSKQLTLSPSSLPALSTPPPLPQHDPFTPSKRRDPTYVPYYVTNFEYVLGCVIDCTDDRELFTSEELNIIQSYRRMSLPARKLYVRLLNRKHVWLMSPAISKYDEISDPEQAASQLVDACLLESKEQLKDLKEALELLPAPSLKQLAKEFNVGGNSKAGLVPELLKVGRRKSAMASFFTSASGSAPSSIELKMMGRVKSLTGDCWRLSVNSRSIFMRVLCLWGLESWWEAREESGGGPPAALTAILLANQGHVTYPEYTIRRQARIFANRAALLAFEEAVREEDLLEQAVASKDFEIGLEVLVRLRSMWVGVGDEEVNHVTELPCFLQRFSSLAVLTCGLSKGVELLEKDRQYEEAVKLLRQLLDSPHLPRYRGHWYERLSLDLDSHLKSPKEALQVVEQALLDVNVRGGRRLMLMQRAEKIGKAKKGKLAEELELLKEKVDWDLPTVEELPTVTVQGKIISKEGQSGTKSVFQVTTLEGVQFCSVEELVKLHYRDLGMAEGLHCEGAALHSLLGILLWDQIYQDCCPDVWRGPGQTLPLDWDTDHFYEARRESVDQRLEEISSMEKIQLEAEVEKVAKLYLGVASIVAWDRLSPTSLASLAGCIGGEPLSKVLGRLARRHREARSGLPDLTVWDPASGRVRMVEVKGPGDRLSTKQILWVRFLNSAGLPTEVCHVVATGSKGIVGTGSAPSLEEV